MQNNHYSPTPNYIFYQIRNECYQNFMKSITVDKWKTYFITFIAYAALHSMRMTYSEVKPEFQRAFQVSDLFLGLLDATAYMSLGLGFFLRFLLQGQRSIMHTYVVYIMIASLGFMIIPLDSLIFGEEVQNQFALKYMLPAFGKLLFGFCQFGAWPTLLTLTNSRFNIKKEGKALGIWSANGDFGNVIGFGLTGLLVDSLGFRWEISMLIAGVFNMLMAMMVLFFVTIKKRSIVENEGTKEELLANQMKDEAGVNQKQQGNAQKKSKFKIFLEFSRQFVRPLSNKLYLIAFGMLKAILYGFLLWMPTQLNNVGFKNYRATILIVFNVGTLLGSLFLGHFYEQPDDGSQGKLAAFRNHFKRFALFYCCILLSAIFGIFYLIAPNVAAYFVLSGICGALLGGCFNMFASNEVIELTGGKAVELQMLSALSMAVGNTSVGIVQLLIGVTLNVKGDADASKKLFLILIGVSTFTVFVLLGRSKLNKAKRGSVSQILRMSLKQ